MWSDAFLAERRGGVFNYDKNKNGKDKNDKDDEDNNNNNKVVVWARALRWVSANGGGKAKHGTMPSWQGGKVTTTRMMMTCHVNKDVDNDVGNDKDEDMDSDKKYINDGHSTRYWGWTLVPYPIVLLHLKDIDKNVESYVDSNDVSNKA